MRDVPERHRSLRAAIDQAWRLLTDEQRSAFSRLSVFRGSFDRGAALAVTGADLSLLSELVSKSLLRRPDFGRFELHELLRQYAAEQLHLLPAEEGDACERHARHYAAMLLERQAALMGPEFAVARDELRGELDNLRAATEWILAEQDEDPALEMLEAIYTFLWMHGWYEGAETLERFERTAGLDADDPESASAVALAAAMYRVTIGARLGYDPEAEELATRCLPVLRARNMERELANCLCSLGMWGVYRDVYTEAAAFSAEGAELARVSGDGIAESGGLMDLGFARLLMDDLESAREAFDAAHVVSGRLGNPILRAYATSKLGLLADAEERFGDALHFHIEAHDLFASVGEAAGLGYALSRASLSAFGLGDYSEALRLGRAGYEAFSESNHRWGLITALCRIGFAALALGDGTEARERFDDALERARDAQAVSLELLALSGIGACLAEDPAEQERAVVILTFAMGHEQLPASYAFAARPALDRLEAELPAEQLAAARAAAAAATLEELERTARQPNQFVGPGAHRSQA
jgi:tetratricopeptide (TPR) repeat protein